MINFENVNINNNLAALNMDKYILLEQRDKVIKTIFPSKLARKKIYFNYGSLNTSKAFKEQYGIQMPDKYYQYRYIENADRYLRRCDADLRAIRVRIKEYCEKKEEGRLKQIWDESQRYFYGEVSDYRNYSWKNDIVRWSLGNKDAIEINLDWKRSVLDKGLPMISTSKGKQFVTHANEVASKNIPDLGNYKLPDSTVFKVTAIRLLSAKPPEVTKGWLLVHNYDKTDTFQPHGIDEERIKAIYHGGLVSDAHKIHSFHKDLKSAGKLLSRRVKSEIMNNLLD